MSSRDFNPQQGSLRADDARAAVFHPAPFLLRPLLQTHTGMWVSPWKFSRGLDCPDRYPDLAPVERFIATGLISTF